MPPSSGSHAETKAKWRDALKELQGRKVLLLGDLVLDAYIYGETLRVSREAPVLVVRQKQQEHRLGGAANTAANLRSLGVETRLVSVVGGDAYGQKLLGLLAGMGVDVGQVGHADTATPVKTRILAGALGTTPQQVLRLDAEADADRMRAAMDKHIGNLESHVAWADAVIVSDYGAGCISADLAGRVVDWAKAGAWVCVDSRYDLARFAGVSAITPNAPEAQALLGRAINGKDPCADAEILRAQLKTEACLLTLGRDGIALAMAGGSQDACPIVGEGEVTDVTGAGDTVLATFAASLAAGLGASNGMRLANCAAGVVVHKTGAAVASPDEICALALGHGVELCAWKKS